MPISGTIQVMPRTKVVRAVVLAVATIAAGAMIAACGGSTTPAASPATSVPSSSLPIVHGAAKLSPGCDPAPAVQAPGTSITIQPVIAGLARTVIVHEPVGYNAGTATPLVLNLHGSQSTAAAQEAFTGMDATADTDQFFVVYPQGAIPAANGFEWNVPNEPLFGGSPVPASAPNDVSFLEQLVSLLEQRYCIDENRVYATGFSGGARMASQLACDASQTFAAVAPVSGLRLPSPCPTTRAVPVLSFHGTADPVDPYGGNGQAYWTYSVPTAAARWGAQNGCSPTATTSNPATTVVVTTYSHCDDGSIVQLYTIVGEGHEWPGGPKLRRSATRSLGPQSTAVSANTTMWSFFMAHPLAST
jgi:polyhydroxybutyrate depolymerase